MYGVLGTLGKTGMQFELFTFVLRNGLHFRLKNKELFEVFAQLDINHNNQISFDEFHASCAVIFKERVPEDILTKLSLRHDQIFLKVILI